MSEGLGHTALHATGAQSEPVPVARRTRTLLGAVAVASAVVLVVGLAVLWPSGRPPLVPGGRLLVPGASITGARVVAVDSFDCPAGSGNGTTRCARVRARVSAGREVTVDVPPDALARGLPVGSGLRLIRVPATAQTPEVWQYYDLDRRAPLFALALGFALVTVLVARLRGLAALVGLAGAFAALFGFVLPALLLGTDPLAVGLVGCGAILFVIVYLAHGVSVRTTCALLGTLAGLLAAAGLGSLMLWLSRLTGAGSDDDLLLRSLDPAISLPGVLLCGLILASLGALNDVTVTQSSAVWELHALQPSLARGALFGSAMRIGRDHIASTVYTLTFAYAGAALPVLLLVELQQAPLGQVAASEQVGAEVVRSLVGAVGVVLAVPLTTAISVLVRTSAAAPLVRDGHAERRGGTGRHLRR